MALIAMAVYDTEENDRTWMTERTLYSLLDTVNFERHRLVISDNGSCQETQDLFTRWLRDYPINRPDRATLIQNGKNIGTAMAINRAWKLREPNEVVVKMDNDVVIHQIDWLDKLVEAMNRNLLLGILGLKRKDLIENPDHPDPFYRSTLEMLPHEAGQEWLVVEMVQHVMGTCQAYSPALLDKIGYLYQMQDEGNLYGFDDSLASYRSHLAGFKTGFLLGIDIDHIDPGGTDFIKWKSKVAGIWMSRYRQVKEEYRTGKRPIYWQDKETK